jgi:general secretion pathway protein J
MRTRRERGFTLLEVLIAISIVGMLLVIAFGGLRVALSAWRQGDDRADVHQHIRGVALIVARGLGAAYPYQATRGLSPERVVLFKGAERRLEFVTQVAPFPLATPIAFTAVVIALEEGEQAGLVIRERALPNRDPFTEAPVVFRDPSVTTLALSYMDDGGGWKDDWDGEAEERIPRAVKVTVGTAAGTRSYTLPALTVSLRSAPRL